MSTVETPGVNLTLLDDEESVRTHLILPPPSAEDVTVECFASNQIGESHEVFHHQGLAENMTAALACRVLLCFPGEDQAALMPALIGAVGAATILFLLLLVVFYKWRQV